MPNILGITIYLPGPMFAAVISLYLFYTYDRVKQAKQGERRESLREIRQQYLQKMIEAKKKGTAGSGRADAKRTRGRG